LSSVKDLNMNGMSTESSATLLNLVAFKWLMAGRGWWVDVPRLQKDATYATVCAQRALDSGSQVLRQHSIEVLALLPPEARRLAAQSMTAMQSEA
jgi:hypothetical protein